MAAFRWRIVALRAAGAWYLALSLGCRAEPPGDGAIYHTALEHARRELRLDRPILLHPLMGRVNRIGPEQGPPISHFNDVDRNVIASAIGTDTTAYALCETSGSGFCQIRGGDVSLVLSEVHDLGPDGEGLVLAVDDRRGSSGLTFYTVRLKHGWRGWRVVAFAPMVAPLVPPLWPPRGAGR